MLHRRPCSQRQVLRANRQLRILDEVPINASSIGLRLQIVRRMPTSAQATAAMAAGLHPSTQTAGPAWGFGGRPWGIDTKVLSGDAPGAARNMCAEPDGSLTGACDCRCHRSRRLSATEQCASFAGRELGLDVVEYASGIFNGDELRSSFERRRPS